MHYDDTLKTTEYTLIPAEVPPQLNARLRELVAEFRTSGLGTARIGGTEGRRGEAKNVRIYLCTYIRRSGIRDVKVIIRGSDVYLVRKES